MTPTSHTKWIRFASYTAALTASAWLHPPFACAQSLGEQALEQEDLAKSTEPWNVTLGAAAVVTPTYPGASATSTHPVPMFSVTYKDRFFLGPFGLGMAAINEGGFHVGPVFGLTPSRSQSNDSHLQGLGDISRGADVGFFALYKTGPFEVLATARQAITHTDSGLIGFVQMTYHAAIFPGKLDLTMGPQADFGNNEHTQTWFGVSASQSAQSGLPAFTPQGGITDAGFNASLTYHYSDHWLFRAFGGATALTGDASKSPIVERRAMGLLGIGIGYHF